MIRITGDPSVEIEITPAEGMNLTPASAVAAIPWVCHAPPRLLTKADVPLFRRRTSRSDTALTARQAPAASCS